MRTKELYHHADMTTLTTYGDKLREASHPSCGCADANRSANAEEQRGDWSDCHLPPRSAAIHRQADRATNKLRRPGRHRHREGATSEVLKVISCSPEDLQPFFDAILKTPQTCGLEFLELRLSQVHFHQTVHGLARHQLWIAKIAFDIELNEHFAISCRKVQPLRCGRPQAEFSF